MLIFVTYLTNRFFSHTSDGAEASLLRTEDILQADVPPRAKRRQVLCGADDVSKSNNDDEGLESDLTDTETLCQRRRLANEPLN